MSFFIAHRARISRSLVTVFILAIIQTVAAPVVLPELVTPRAEAVIDSYTPAQATSWTVPANVTSITVTLKGGSAGVGGTDCGADCISEVGGPRGVVTYTFNVTVGDLIGIFPGNKGVDGNGSATPVGGSDTTFLGNFDGGAGGAIGDFGGSGKGGGGGAASVLTINGVIRAVAGGAGGGGGAGNVANSGTAGQDYDSSRIVSNSYTGGTGTKPGPTTCAATAQTNNTRDGGGGGGGGGGWFAGSGGAVYVLTGGNECAGYGGSRGGNYLKDNSNTETIGTAGISEPASDTNGSIDITYTPASSFSSCSPSSTTDVDIYRVLKFTNVNSCTWTIPAGVSSIDFFSVGGGGGGGADGGSGGAGGGSISRSALVVSAGNSLTLTVGSGGYKGVFESTLPSAGLPSIVSTGTTTFTSNGGGAGNQGPGDSVYPSGGTTSNGTTAIGLQGGVGGLGARAATSGTPGGSGSTNYFFGVENKYGGGGAGGVYPDSNGTWAAVASIYGGGSGAASSGGVNTAGSDGAANTGGGGGGGAANYNRTSGGRGADGVILIRYAINQADAFPATLAGALVQRFTPGDLQLAGNTWLNSAGTSAPIASFGATKTGLSITTQSTLDSTYSTGSSKSLLAVKGTTSSKLTFGDIPSNYTLFHVARFMRGTTGTRIVTANGTDWTSGFDTAECQARHGNWLTNSSGSKNYNWTLTTDQNVIQRCNGADVALNDSVNYNFAAQLASVTNYGINNYSSGASDFEIADLLVFNRQLSNGEMRLMEAYLARIYGLTLSPFYYTSETDTAYYVNGNDLFIQSDSRNNLNDTFTVEMWLKPDSTCDSTNCTMMATEDSFRFKIQNGLFYYILKGSDAWEWVTTGVAVKSGEWHHLAISKTLSGNNNNSVKVYLDGQLAFTKAGDPYKNATTNVASPSNSNTLAKITSRRNIGCIFNGSERYYGLIDELKIWSAARTDAQIKTDMYSNDASETTMQGYYDFNYINASRINDFKVVNLAAGGSPRSDLYATAAPSGFTYNDVKSVTTSSPYTVVTFPRAYITQNGGWKVPDSITAASALVVGGAGGGGNGWHNAGAGGGAGGMVLFKTVSLPSGQSVSVTVGVGGLGSPSVQYDASANAGENSIFRDVTALGGSAGLPGRTYSANGARSGGLAQVDSITAPTGGSGGGSSAGGGGGGGATAAGSVSSGATGGAGGTGLVNAISGTDRTYGAGGKGGNGSTTATGANGAALLGQGGGGGAGGSGASAAGGNGGSGSIIIRYITALKPTYTKPTIAYLNVGMTETFTTNVAVDSATVAGLTRTFKWESTTPTANGSYTLIKQGTGAPNAAFSWIPSDTSTSGSGYLYRLTVTDSDTAGLFISDSSTAYAVINQPLNVVGNSSIAKTINLARSETFTITLGTPSYKASLSPVISGITLDTSTAGYAVLKISDTATVGTWLETLTVTDSVSAVLNIPLTIKINAPPTLLNTNEIVTNGQILNLDAGNSRSILLNDGAAATSVVWRDLSGNQKDAQTSGTYDLRSCAAPTYSSSNGGFLNFNGTDQCYRTPDLGQSISGNFTAEAWFKMSSSSWAGSTTLITQNWPTANNVGFALGGANGSANMRIGFYNGNWVTSVGGYTPVQNRWTHVAGTYDGQNLKFYVDGVLQTGMTQASTATLSGGLNNNGYSIGKSWAGGAWFNGSIGSIRVYNRALSDTEVAQNFNSTKYRFDNSNVTIIKPNQKYGVLTLESFTATSGGDTKTVTFSATPRQGVVWDTTSTPGQIKLSVGESLSAGTYYDTVTVTDNLGASTYLPLTFTVTKADTITVTSGPSLTTVYSGSIPLNGPQTRVTGLVGKDTATVSSLYSYTSTGGTCATGGACSIGDRGPGGGWVFYIAPTSINASTGISYGGTHLEIAPLNWLQGGEASNKWSTTNSVVGSTSSAVGSGAENTSLIVKARGSDAEAAYMAANSNYGGKDDWFLPSSGELEQAYLNLKSQSKGDLGGINYWSSTEYPTLENTHALNYWMGSNPNAGGYTKINSLTWRPIRAFTPGKIETTTAPVDVETYTVKGAELTFQIGALSNYQGVIYETSTLKITQANQNKLVINLYGAVAGQPFTLQVTGGSGTGAVTETVTAGGTATNCAISNHVLSNSNLAGDQKTCIVKVTKAASRNYFVESLTATVYFMGYIDNQPRNQVGSGSTIALNGINQIWAEPGTVPTITSFPASGTRGSRILIGGSGFNTPILIVEFNFYQVATVITKAPDGSQVEVEIPSGATSGPITITNSYSTAFSATDFTVG